MLGWPEDTKSQPKAKANDFKEFSLAFEESTDIINPAQFLCMREVTTEREVTQELPF